MCELCFEGCGSSCVEARVFEKCRCQMRVCEECLETEDSHNQDICLKSKQEKVQEAKKAKEAVAKGAKEAAAKASKWQRRSRRSKCRRH